MSYSKSIANSASDLLNRIADFLTASGCTQLYRAAEGAGIRAHIQFPSGTVLSLRSAVSEIITPNSPTQRATGLLAIAGTGYSAGATVFNQPGVPVNAASSNAKPTPLLLSTAGANTLPYYLFWDGATETFAAVVEVSPGVFGHIIASGTVRKIGTWTGGMCLSGSAYGSYTLTSDIPLAATVRPFALAYASYLRADVPGFTGKFLSADTPSVFTSNTTQMYGYTGRNFSELHSALYQKTASSMTGELHLLPVRLAADNGDGTNSVICDVPNVFLHSMTPGLDFGSDYVLGSDTYVVFPGFSIKKTP